MTNITYTKLRNGQWGLRGTALTPGETVRVGKRDGSIRTEVVGRVIWTGPNGVTLATVGGRAQRPSYTVKRRPNPPLQPSPIAPPSASQPPAWGSEEWAETMGDDLPAEAEYDPYDGIDD